MSDKFKRSSLGYGFLTSDQTYPKTGAMMFHGIREANPEVIEVWNSYKTLVSQQPPIGLVLKAITAAKRSFGADFLHWMTVQVTANPDLSDYRIRFLRDTLRFVNGHNREYGLNTWNTLLNLPVSEVPESIDTKTKVFDDVVIPKTTAELISLWLSRPDGSDDMVHSLNLLFGK